MTKVIIVGGSITSLSLTRAFSPYAEIHLILTHKSNIAQHSKYVKSSKLISYKDDPDGRILTEYLVNDKTKHGSLIVADNDYSAYILSRAKKRLSKFYTVQVPNINAMKYCYDKRFTYDLCAKSGIPAPQSWYPDNENQLKDIVIPSILKPTVCFQFKKQFRAKAIMLNNRQDLHQHFLRTKKAGFKVCVSELIPGETSNLYLHSFYVSKGVFVQHLAQKIREAPPVFGSASVIKSIPLIPEVSRQTKRFAAATGYDGFGMIEYKYNPATKKYYLIDVNPRPILFYSIFRKAGVDFTSLILGRKVSPRKYAHDVYWISIVGDVYYYLLKGKKYGVSIKNFFSPYLKNKAFGVLSLRDPVPFFYHVKNSILK